MLEGLLLLEVNHVALLGSGHIVVNLIYDSLNAIVGAIECS